MKYANVTIRDILVEMIKSRDIKVGSRINHPEFHLPNDAVIARDDNYLLVFHFGQATSKTNFEIIVERYAFLFGNWMKRVQWPVFMNTPWLTREEKKLAGTEVHSGYECTINVPNIPTILGMSKAEIFNGEDIEPGIWSDGYMEAFRKEYIETGNFNELKHSWEYLFNTPLLESLGFDE